MIGRIIERAVGYLLLKRLVEQRKPVAREADLNNAPEPGAGSLCERMVHTAEAGQRPPHDRLRPVLGRGVRAVLDIHDEGIECAERGGLRRPEDCCSDLGEKLEWEIVHGEGTHTG